jgi:hypothetical protein
VISLLDMSDLEVDPDTLEADAEIISSKIGDLKKAKPYLFSKSGPGINNKMPNGKTKPEAEKKEDLSKLSAQQLRDRLRELDK